MVNLLKHMLKNIQRLREKTSAGVMDCKKALEDAKGDFDKAVKLIHKRGLIKAEKKGDRATGAGIIKSYVHNGRIGVLLEFRTETDFAIKSESVQYLIQELLMQIVAMVPNSIEELLKQNYIRDESLSISDLIKRVVAEVGENIKIERFCRYEI